MPFYSAYTASGYLTNNLQDLLDQKDLSSFALSKLAALSPTTTRKICSEVAQKLGASSIKDMGKVMGELKKNYSDTLDFSKAGSILKEILGK